MSHPFIYECRLLLANKNSNERDPIAVHHETKKIEFAPHSEIALQDEPHLDSPTFLKRRTSGKSNETFSTSAKLPFPHPSSELIFLRMCTLEVRASIFTSAFGSV